MNPSIVSKAIQHAICILSAASLCACGGGGDGLASAPSPIPPVDPPASPIAPPIPAGPIGLTGDQPFKTYSARTDGWGGIFTAEDEIAISYSAENGRYRFNGAELVFQGANGSWNANGWIKLQSTTNYTKDASGQPAPDPAVTLDWPGSSSYSYSSFGTWSAARPFGEDRGQFAYGTPTLAADMPVSGRADYTGDLRGLTNGEPSAPGEGVRPVLEVWGTVSLAFDFGAGTLSGKMEPEYAPEWDPVPLGTYTFRDTVYATGSTNFSGAFIVPGSTAPSAFHGSFTGPLGRELMASWFAPYFDSEIDGWATMAGVWIAKTGN